MKWEIRIIEQPGKIGKDLIIYRYFGDRIQVVNFNEEGECIIKTLKPGDGYAAPTMKLGPDLDERSIISAFQVAGEVFGIKRPDESFIAGELGATKKHLADMRTIVFKDGSALEVI